MLNSKVCSLNRLVLSVAEMVRFIDVDERTPTFILCLQLTLIIVVQMNVVLHIPLTDWNLWFRQVDFANVSFPTIKVEVDTLVLKCSWVFVKPCEFTQNDCVLFSSSKCCWGRFLKSFSHSFQYATDFFVGIVVFHCKPDELVVGYSTSVNSVKGKSVEIGTEGFVGGLGAVVSKVRLHLGCASHFRELEQSVLRI